METQISEPCVEQQQAEESLSLPRALYSQLPDSGLLLFLDRWMFPGRSAGKNEGAELIDSGALQTVLTLWGKDV